MPQTKRPWMLRRNYLIDRPTQLRLIAQLLLGFVVIAGANVAAVLVFFGNDSMAGPGSGELRGLLLKAIGAFFFVVSFLLVALGILLTHRFVGPAYVFRRALEGMQEGDYGRRLSLRKSDYLQDLSTKFIVVRDRGVSRDPAVLEGLARIEACIASGDDRTAAEIARSLREGALVVVAPDAAPAAAPVASPPAALPAKAAVTAS